MKTPEDIAQWVIDNREPDMMSDLEIYKTLVKDINDLYIRKNGTIDKANDTGYKNNLVPIYRGCNNSTCFCSGACKEIIGYRDKLIGEY